MDRVFFARQGLAILDNLREAAVRLTRCKRKGVGCGVYSVFCNHLAMETRAFNGPTEQGPYFDCTNEVGKCGCMHAEIRAILRVLEQGRKSHKHVMFCTYSPCTNCANAILECGFIKGVVYETLTQHDQRGIERLNASIKVFAATELRILSDNPKTEHEALDAALARWTTEA
jgi:deoxycytidylate deaminase